MSNNKLIQHNKRTNTLNDNKHQLFVVSRTTWFSPYVVVFELMAVMWVPCSFAVGLVLFFRVAVLLVPPVFQLFCPHLTKSAWRERKGGQTLRTGIFLERFCLNHESLTIWRAMFGRQPHLVIPGG